jgi:hypothetical protein
VDKLDQICKEHDYAIWLALTKSPSERVKRKNLAFADRQFRSKISKANLPGIKDNIAGFCVWAGGPAPNIRQHSDTEHLSPQEKTPAMPTTSHSKKRLFSELEEESPEIDGSLSILRPSNRKKNMDTTNQKVQERAAESTNSHLTETPIDKVYNVERGPSNYVFASLPYYTQWMVTRTVFSDQFQYRMTSPYDVRVGGTEDDLNINAVGLARVEKSVADATDVTATKARWFDYYANMYKYYSVVACRWHITFENKGDAPIWLHWWYQNEEDRPQGAGNLDMLAWKDTHSHYIDCQHVAIQNTGQNETSEAPANENEVTAEAVTSNNIESVNISKRSKTGSTLQLSGEYRPGDYDSEIILDEKIENWTAIDKNPKLSERLCFRVRPWSDGIRTNSASNFEDVLKYTYLFRCEYLVEFKDLKEGLKYPVQNQPALVTIQKTIDIA